MIFIGYHLTYAYEIYNIVDKKVHINRDVIFDGFEVWKYKAKDTMDGEIRCICVDYDENEESCEDKPFMNMF